MKRSGGSFHPNQWQVRWTNLQMKRYAKSSVRRIAQSASRRAQGRPRPPAAVNTHPHWNEQYERLRRRKPTNKAIVATARKLLVVVWHVLTEREADRRADPDMVAFKLMVWSWKLGKERRGSLSTPQFVRAGLMRLETGEDLPHISRQANSN